MLVKRLVHLLSALTLAIPLAAPVFAQVPKVVRIVVPLSAGGGADIIARIVAEQISRANGISVIVENPRAPALRSGPIMLRAQSPTAPHC